MYRFKLKQRACRPFTGRIYTYIRFKFMHGHKFMIYALRVLFATRHKAGRSAPIPYTNIINCARYLCGIIFDLIYLIRNKLT